MKKNFLVFSIILIFFAGCSGKEKNISLIKETNQDLEIEESGRSPGWIRYQKRIK